MTRTFIIIFIIAFAGCASANNNTIHNPDPPQGMETIDLPGVLEISESTTSALPPEEPESIGKLVKGDQIAIKVYEQPDLSMELRIPQSGKVSYPVIGELYLAGKTIAEIEADLKKRLEEKILNSAQVTVLIKSYNKRSVFVLGSVEKPGSFEISFGKKLSFLQVVSLAGGFSNNADQDSIMLLRISEGKRQVYRISYRDIIAKPDPEKTVNLVDGDVIIVNEQGKVYILGKVNRPGGFPIPSEQKLTLTKVISLAGGFDPLAAKSKVSVIRSLQDGSKRIFRIDIRQVFSGSLSDPVLSPGDIIYVPESFF